MAGEKQPLSIKDALMRETTLVIAPGISSTTLLERPKKGEPKIPPPPTVENALRAAMGNDYDKFSARVAGRIVTGHLRKGDVIVVAKETEPGRGYTLHGPLEITGELWNREANMGAGHVQTSTFFTEVAKLAHPMYPARRAEPENGYFELRHA